MAIGARQGLKAALGGREPTTEFRTTMTTPGGLGESHIFSGRVVNVDQVNYTVDVVSQFDQMRLLQIPISSPYLHSNRGEGFSVTPEIGSKCYVCWPGDSSPPFLLCFVMPHEVVDDSSEESPAGTQPKGDTNKAPVTASFAGGRPKSKGGDIALRGRDGNQVVLHRGGVLQIGSNELSQRLYIPLNNLIMDFCENYALHNAGGSINWGLQEGEGSDNLPAQYSQTFRVFANENYADVRVACGKVHTPVPDTDTGITNAGIGQSSPIVYELALAKAGFRADDGGLAKAAGSALKLRVFFDRDGNAGARFDGNVYIRCKKKLTLQVDQDIEVRGGAGFTMQLEGDGKIASGGTIEISGAVLRLNGGKTAVAKVGDNVTVTLPPMLLMAAPTPTGFAPILPTMYAAAGVITGPGNTTILI